MTSRVCLQKQQGSRLRCFRHQLLRKDDILPSDTTRITAVVSPGCVLFVFHVRYYIRKRPGKDDDDSSEYVMINFAEKLTFGFLDLLENEFDVYMFLQIKLLLDVPNRYQKRILSPFMQNDPCNANTAFMGMVVAIDLLDVAPDEIPTKLPCIQPLERFEIIEEDLNIVKECAICLDQPSLGDEVVSLSCAHTYHHLCIGLLLQKSKSCPLCPLCRRPFTIFTGSVLQDLVK